MTTADTTGTGRASAGEHEDKVERGTGETVAEGVPPSGVALWSRSGKAAAETENGDGVALVTETLVRREENWLPLTKKEKRRLWLNRRRSGDFYFRSEFKGLVHAVRVQSNPKAGIYSTY